MADIAHLSVKVTSKGIEIADKELAKLARTADKTEQSVDRLGQSDRKVSRLSGAFRALGGALAALGVAKITGDILRTADSMTRLRGQLALVTDSQEELNAAYDRSLEVANRTGQAIDSTVNLYARLSRSTEELNLSQDQLFTLTEAINQSFIVSGASAQESAAAILQLSQGMASGVLRGEELNSVMENSPRLARALADGLGVTIGQLRQMGADGELTAERVTGALLKMSDDIEADFEKMPMTLGRAWQALSNEMTDAVGRVDVTELAGEVDDLRKIISDPAFKDAIATLSTAMFTFTKHEVKAVSTLVGLFKFMAEQSARAKFGPDPGKLADITQEYERLSGQLDKLRTMTFPGVEERIAETEAKMEKLRKQSEELTFGTHELGNAQEDLKGKTEEVAAATEALTEIRVTAERIDRDAVSNARNLIDALKFEREALTLTGRELAIATALRRADALATPEQRAEIEKLAGALYDEQAAMAAVKEETERVEAAMDPFAEALEGTAERIDSAFADAWKGAFRSFDDFASGIKDALLQLLGELAHIAITKPITMNVGAAFGLGAGSSYASTGAGGAGGFSGASAVGSGLSFAGMGGNFFNNLGGGYQSLGRGLMNLGDSTGFAWLNNAGESAYSVGTDYASGSLAGNLGTAAVNVGAGFAGGWAGTKLGESLFGKEAESSTFSTVGGVVGSIWGPWGTAIGAGIGGLIDSLLGSSNKQPNNGQKFQFDAATGQVISTGDIQEESSRHNMEAVLNVIDLFSNFTNALGGSSASLEVRRGDRTGWELNGQSFSDEMSLVEQGIRDIINAATDLSPELKSLMLNFQGTTEETIAYSVAMASIGQLMTDNPAERAATDFANALEAAGTTLAGAYDTQLASLTKLIAEYDGSASATVALNDALVLNKGLAYQLATAINAVGVEIQALTDSSNQHFLLGGMNEQELAGYRIQEAHRLRDEIGALSDPFEIQAHAQEINRLARALFDSFAPEDRARFSQDFIDFTSEVNTAVQDRLAELGVDLSATQEQLNQDLGAMLQTAATAFQAPVDDFGRHVTAFGNTPITVNVRLDSGLQEVNV